MRGHPGRERHRRLLTVPDGHTDSAGQGQGWQQPEKQSKSPHWPLVCNKPKVQLGTPPSLVPPRWDGGESNHPGGGAPLPHKPGDIRAPSHHPLPLPPPLVPRTLISHPVAPCEGEEVPEEEGFPPAHSGCPSHCRASGILAGAGVPARAHLPSRFRVEGTQRCHSSALKGVSTERSPHSESRGAPGKIKPKVCH